jgi:hypothetical protein
MPKAIDADRETVKLLYIQGVKTSVIAAETGVKQGTIKTWANRYGWNQLGARANAVLVSRGEARLRESTRTLQAASQALRGGLSEELLDQLAVLRSQPPRRTADLGNSPRGQGRAAVAKTLAEAASLVHDWDAEHAPGLIVVGLVERYEPEDGEMAPAVEIEPAGVGSVA